MQNSIRIALSMFMPLDETVTREERSVWYVGGYSLYPKPIWGRLLLTNRRLAFIQQRVLDTETRKFEDVKLCVESSHEKLQDAKWEIRESVIGVRRFAVLVITLNTMGGVEHPAFQVRDPEEWALVIEKAKAASGSY
jgi:hypothetical protein